MRDASLDTHRYEEHLNPSTWVGCGGVCECVCENMCVVNRDRDERGKKERIFRGLF